MEYVDELWRIWLTDDSFRPFRVQDYVWTVEQQKAIDLALTNPECRDTYAGVDTLYERCQLLRFKRLLVLHTGEEAGWYSRFPHVFELLDGNEELEVEPPQPQLSPRDWYLDLCQRASAFYSGFRYLVSAYEAEVDMEAKVNTLRDAIEQYLVNKIPETLDPMLRRGRENDASKQADLVLDEWKDYQQTRDENEAIAIRNRARITQSKKWEMIRSFRENMADDSTLDLAFQRRFPQIKTQQDVKLAKEEADDKSREVEEELDDNKNKIIAAKTEIALIRDDASLTEDQIKDGIQGYVRGLLALRAERASLLDEARRWNNVRSRLDKLTPTNEGVWHGKPIYLVDLPFYFDADRKVAVVTRIEQMRYGMMPEAIDAVLEEEQDVAMELEKEEEANGGAL
jgi:hypothetical protein